MKTGRGFTLIELIVGMIIFGILLALSMPAFSGWIRNAKIRTTAESMQNGLQLARAEAVKRNATVLFQLTTTTDNTCALSTAGPNWVISRLDVTGNASKCATTPTLPDFDPTADPTNPQIIQLRPAAEGSDNVTTVLAGQSVFTFNGIGRVTAPANIDVKNPTAGLCMPAGGVRCLKVVVSAGGQIRMCDPALPTTDAQGGC